MWMERIYLDCAATTRVRPEVVDVMVPLLANVANPSSLHADGRAARAVVDAARASVASLLAAAPREIVFTASGTEADVLAIVGAARARAAQGKHVVASAIEHRAVLRALDLLASDGWDVTLVPARAGFVDPADVAAALRPDTTLVSVMLANNELGTVQPLAAISRLVRAHGALLHTDAIQAAGYVDLGELTVDLLTLSAHKFSGPQGAGVLYVRRGTPLEPLIVGGGQEQGLRAGTESVAAIAGLARALELAQAERGDTVRRVSALREALEEEILARVPGAQVLGAEGPRLPHIAAIAFAEITADMLLMALDLEGVSASAGSACAAGSIEPSHVVAALGLPEVLAHGVVRFSLGRTTTAADVQRATAAVAGIVERLRSPGLAV